MSNLKDTNESLNAMKEEYNDDDVENIKRE